MGFMRAHIFAAVIAAATLSSAGTALAQAASDSLATATPIPGVPFRGTTDVSGATSSRDERPTCIPSAVQSVWYRYDPRVAGTLTARTRGSDYDTVLTVWEGAPNEGGRQVACNDDDGETFQSIATFAVRGLIPYYFQIARYSEQAGGGNLLSFDLQPAAVAPPPPNDEIDHAQPIPGIPFTTTLDVSGATASSGDPLSTCAMFGGAPTVWYSRAPSVDEALLIDTSGSAPGMSVTVFQVGAEGLTQVSCSRYSLQSVRLHGGERYYFMVAAPPPRPGSPMALHLAVTLLPPPPVNDTLAGATVISALPYSIEGIDTRGATRDPSDPTCMAGEENTVWFAYTPTQSGEVLADVAGSDYMASVSVYSSSGGALTQIACRPVYYYGMPIPLTAGQTYYFMVAALPGPGLLGGRLSFHLTPALAMNMTVGSYGLASLATGAVQVHGTITCTVPAHAYFSGSLRQRSGRGYLHGSFHTSVMCGTSPSTWRATFTSDTSVPGTPMGRFGGGPADLEVSGWAFTDAPPYQSVMARAQATITLRGTSPKSLTVIEPPRP